MSINDLVCEKAVHEDMREGAFRVRYEVYIEEQGKLYPNADEKRRMLHDELDRSSDILIVRSHANFVGTVRANWFSCAETERSLGRIFETNRFERVPTEEMAVCSRLAVLDAWRSSGSAQLLFEHIYRIGQSNSSQLCFSSCKPKLLPFFKRYGFREYLQPYADPHLGQLHRCVLLLNDVRHLHAVRSPFRQFVHPAQHNPELASWFVSNFFPSESPPLRRNAACLT